MKLKFFSLLSTSVASLVLLATSASAINYTLEKKINIVTVETAKKNIHFNNVQTTYAEQTRENVQFKSVIFVESAFQATQSNQSDVVRENNHRSAKLFTFIFAIICFIVVWMSVVAIIAAFSRFERKRNKDEPIIYSLFEQVSCRKCKYFHKNHYLHCAVHPTITLTKEALNCPDYCPKA